MTSFYVLMPLLFYICCSCSHKSLLVDNFENHLAIQARAIEDESQEKKYEVRIANAQRFLKENYATIMHINSLSWASHRIYFDSMEKMLFYVKDERFNPVLERFYWELQAANFVKESDRKTVFSYYVRDRQFEDAANFLDKLPDWQSKEFRKPPKVNLKIANEDKAFFLKVIGKNSLEVAPFPASFTGLVIIGSPSCHFTSNALKDILKNKGAFPRLDKNFLLLIPQETIELEQIISWNNAHADLPYQLVYRERAFKDFSFSLLPTFYFLKNGKIVDEVSGWPKEGRMSEIKEGFKKL